MIKVAEEAKKDYDHRNHIAARNPEDLHRPVNGASQEKRRVYSLGALIGFNFDAAQRRPEAVDSTPD